MNIDFLIVNSSLIIDIVILIFAAAVTSLSAFWLLQLLADGLKRQFGLYLATRKMYHSQRQADKTTGISEWRVYRVLDFLLQATTKANQKSTHRFLVMLCTIFTSSFLFLQLLSIRFFQDGSSENQFSGLIFRMIISLVTTSLPILWLVIKLRLIRIQSGYDLATVSGILLSKYRKHNKRMYDALVEAAENTRNIYIKRRFYRIIQKAQTFKGIDELKREIDIFVFSINTTFARQMGVAILKAFSTTNSIDVEKSLEANDSALQHNIQMMNDEKSNNLDTLQLGWLHLAVFPLSIWAVLMFLSPAHYWQFQFETDSGRIWFVLSVVSVLGSVFVALWFRKPPNDL